MRLSRPLESKEHYNLPHACHSFNLPYVAATEASCKAKKTKFKAYSGTLTRREIVRANASLGELRRDKEKLSSPISCEFVRVKAS